MIVLTKLRPPCHAVARGTRRLSHLKNARKNALLDRVLRVDHAGEVGADMIYAGQLAVLGRTSVGPLIQEMRDQEVHHRVVRGFRLPLLP